MDKYLARLTNKKINQYNFKWKGGTTIDTIEDYYDHKKPLWKTI